MPAHQLPIRSGAHRIAAIALYRALLTQCRAVLLPEAERNQLQNIVRNRFKHARHSQSTRLLKVSFEAGYEAIDHLDAAVAGSEASSNYIIALLKGAPARIKLAPASNQVSTAPKEITTLQRGEEVSSEPKISLFERPLPLEKLSGKRHVPILFNAQGIPVLRVKKPQPASLSRFIRSRLLQRHNWHETRARLYRERDLAACEDEWDDLMNMPKAKTLIGAMTSAVTQEPSWRIAIDDAIHEVQQKMVDERRKNQVMARKMQAVVDRERELFEKERVERKSMKRKERLLRRRQRIRSALHAEVAGIEGEKIESRSLVSLIRQFMGL